ncbi:hypothetical protein [Rhodohalobacter sp. 8-1]|uniref:hypothetical protein n=1 Tax=Rhodohalobacter sp. 8-1 TaxID=3131972 RepID=UPI0030ECC7D4
MAKAVHEGLYSAPDVGSTVSEKAGNITPRRGMTVLEKNVLNDRPYRTSLRAIQQ